MDQAEAALQVWLAKVPIRVQPCWEDRYRVVMGLLQFEPGPGSFECFFCKWVLQAWHE